MDLREICGELAERYPQWAQRIGMLEFRDVPGVHPVDNDGRAILYNGRLMQYHTREAQSFYIAQQLLHLQLAHHARGSGRERDVWKQASDAVVNAMLKADGFQPPEDSVSLPEAAEASAEELYEVLLARTDRKEKDEPETEQLEPQPKEKGQKAGKSEEARTREIEDPGLAAVIAGLAEMLEPSMHLDFDWFPGSTIRHGVLGHEFRAYPVAHAEILLDTSASVDADLLRAFVRGVKGLMRQDAVIRVGCFDTRFYGFQDIRSDMDPVRKHGDQPVYFPVPVHRDILQV